MQNLFQKVGLGTEIRLSGKFPEDRDAACQGPSEKLGQININIPHILFHLTLRFYRTGLSYQKWLTLSSLGFVINIGMKK